MPKSFDDLVRHMIEHRLFMANAHATWELLYGTPCGPYDEWRAGRPLGIRASDDLRR
jgi:hypothetical protein